MPFDRARLATGLDHHVLGGEWRAEGCGGLAGGAEAVEECTGGDGTCFADGRDVAGCGHVVSYWRQSDWMRVWTAIVAKVLAGAVYKRNEGKGIKSGERICGGANRTRCLGGRNARSGGSSPSCAWIRLRSSKKQLRIRSRHATSFSFKKILHLESESNRFLRCHNRPTQAPASTPHSAADDAPPPRVPHSQPSRSERPRSAAHEIAHSQ